MVHMSNYRECSLHRHGALWSRWARWAGAIFQFYIRGPPCISDGVIKTYGISSLKREWQSHFCYRNIIIVVLRERNQTWGSCGGGVLIILVRNDKCGPRVRKLPWDWRAGTVGLRGFKSRITQGCGQGENLKSDFSEIEQFQVMTRSSVWKWC